MSLTCPAWPACYCVAQPTASCQSPSTSCHEDERRMATAREHAPRHLLLPTAAPSRQTMPRHPGPPLAFSLALIPFLGSLSLTTERGSSPPTPSTAATGHPTPRRRAKKLRLIPLFLLTESRHQESPEGTPSTSSPTTAGRDRRRQFIDVEASPSPLSFSPDPL